MFTVHKMSVLAKFTFLKDLFIQKGNRMLTHFPTKREGEKKRGRWSEGHLLLYLPSDHKAKGLARPNPRT